MAGPLIFVLASASLNITILLEMRVLNDNESIPSLSRQPLQRDPFGPCLIRVIASTQTPRFIADKQYLDCPAHEVVIAVRSTAFR